MIRVGLVDCDTSHVVQFTMRMNHVGIDEDQWVDGAQVVAAVPGLSDLSIGDDVALHWGWVCARLPAHQLQDLKSSHAKALRLANLSGASRQVVS